jgi:hypothetical protein
MIQTVYEWSDEDGNKVTCTQSGRTHPSQYALEDKPAVFCVHFKDAHNPFLNSTLYHGLDWYEAEKAISAKVMELEASLFT